MLYLALLAGRLAQLEERLVYTQEVGSSRLSPPTILLRMLRETGAMNIECPATMRRHVQKVLGGEYEVPYSGDAAGNPRYRRQCRKFRGLNFAIGDPSLKNLYLGRNNCGEASFYDVGEQSEITVEVETMEPSVLPKAHIVKIDTEGSEIDILSRMTSLDFDVIMLEYHSEANRRKIEELLRDFFLVGGEIRGLHRGTLKYFHATPDHKLPACLCQGTSGNSVSQLAT